MSFSNGRHGALKRTMSNLGSRPSKRSVMLFSASCLDLSWDLLSTVAMCLTLDKGEDKRNDRSCGGGQSKIERTGGMFAHLVPGVSLANELVADRRAEVRAEEQADEAERS